MKTRSIFFLLFSLVACTKEEVPISKSQMVISTMTTGIWTITNYNDSGVDETSDFDGYTFVFSTSGAMTANIGTAINPGTWYVSDNNSGEDDLDDLSMNLTFIAPPILADLTDDWAIIEVTSRTLKLTTGSSGDSITFFKN